MKEIKYHIDHVIVNNNIRIKGWAFVTGAKDLHILINGKKLTYDSILRPDIAKKFGNEALYSGFEIEVLLMRKISIEFQSNISKEIVKLYPLRNKFLAGFFKLYKYFLKSLKYLARNGCKQTINKIYRFFKKQSNGIYYTPNELYQRTIYNKQMLERIKNTKLTYTPKIGIIVSLLNTSAHYLKDMVQSVKDQLYDNWELCMVDSSDYTSGQIIEICEAFSKSDHRIIYKKLDNNFGICENLNFCLSLTNSEYIALLDQDDILHEAALFEVINVINNHQADFVYSDEITFKGSKKTCWDPKYKPDFGIDTLRSNNYICHLSVFSSVLLKEAGNFSNNCDGAQDFDLFLRLSEKARCIHHIPKILYYRRTDENSSTTYGLAESSVIEAEKNALLEHLKRVGLQGIVETTHIPRIYKINYQIDDKPLISILIPNKDHIDDLDHCIKSVQTLTTYDNYEIIIIENNSEDEATFEYYRNVECELIKVVKYIGYFNYSAINNFGIKYANGSYFIFLNNDVEVITRNWIEEMLMFCQRKDVGAVGAILYYPDDTIQHAGVILGLGGIASHAHKGFHRDDRGYMNRIQYAHNLSAVTAACMLVTRNVYFEVGGFNEELAVAFNDVDFCLRMRKKNHLIVFTPFAKLYHYESKSRGNDESSQKKIRFMKEIQFFSDKWKKELLNGDPYYNENLTLSNEKFDLKN